MWLEGEDSARGEHSGVELILLTLWWMHVFIPLLFFSAIISIISMLNAILSSVNFWNL